MRRLSAIATVVAAAVISAMPAFAQSSEPIKIIFPYAAGGSGDGLARLMAEHLRISLNQPVIVENRTGAQGRIGVQAVKSAAPDGNTMLLTPIAPVSIYQLVYKALGYDPVKDLAPISQVATFDFALAVALQVPSKSLKELVAWVKANPGQGSYGTPAAGALPHFFAVSFARAADLDLRHVSYRGSAAAMIDLIAGQIPIVVTTTSDVLENHKGGKIRVLATSDASRSPFLPDIPTFKESGYDIQGTGWYAFFAPAGTPADVIDRLNKGLVGAVRKPEVKERFMAFGLQPTGTTAAELGRMQVEDSKMWEPAVKASGFTPEQ